MPETRNEDHFNVAGALTVGAKPGGWVAPFAGDLDAVIASVGTAPTGSPLIVDILKNGVTVFTTAANRPTIAAGATVSPLSARPDVTSFVAGDVLTVSVAQVGSTVAGSDLEVTFEYTGR
jgi:hypothetical protein